MRNYIVNAKYAKITGRRIAYSRFHIQCRNVVSKFDNSVPNYIRYQIFAVDKICDFGRWVGLRIAQPAKLYSIPNIRSGQRYAILGGGWGCA